MALSKKDVIKDVDAAFARNDVEAFLAYCDDDFVWTMVGSDPVKGKDAIRKFVASGPSEPPSFTANTVIAEGDFVTSVGDMTMNENGTVAPYSYCDVWRFRGDRLVELRAFVIKTNAVTV